MNGIRQTPINPSIEVQWDSFTHPTWTEAHVCEKVPLYSMLMYALCSPMVNYSVAKSRTSASGSLHAQCAIIAYGVL